MLQKSVIRTINKAHYNSHTDPSFYKNGILKVNDLYESQVALFMQDYITNTLPLSFDKTYKFNYEIQEDHQTRQSKLLYIERCNSTFASRLPYYKFPIIWNKWTNIITHY
jgi:hypothetical protein